MSKWKIEGSVEAFKRWDASDHPPSNRLKAETLRWLLRDLADDPWPPGATPMGQPFDVTWWFARLPFGSTAASRVVCVYRIDDSRRVITCSVLDELNLPV